MKPLAPEARRLAKRLQSTHYEYPHDLPTSGRRVADYEPEDVQRAAELLTLMADQLDKEDA